MKDCIFCKIVSSEIQAAKVFEDEDFLAFMDIHPVTPGHTLVVPKVHADKFEVTSIDTVNKIFSLVRVIGPKIAKAMGTNDFNVSVNNGVAAGQSVFHTHIHIIPRKPQDGLVNWESADYQGNEMEEVAKKIRVAIKD